MRGKSILFVHEIPIKEVKANLIQTLNMCFAFSKIEVKTKLLILTSISIDEAKDTIEHIIPSYQNYFEIEFIPYQPTRNYFSSGDRFKVLKNHIDLSFDYIFTRSPLVSLYVTRKGKHLIYESHNAYFTKNKVLNRYYTYKFKRLTKKPSFKLFLTISDNLKHFWNDQGIPSPKLLGLHDGTSAHGEIVAPPEPYPFDKNDRLKVTYTGSLYEDRGLRRILNLAADFPQLDFVIVGGPEKNAIAYREEAKQSQLHNIVFTGYTPHKYIPYYLEHSDILLALWSKSVPTINYCSPLKVFEYMYANKLIVADGFITIKEVLKNNENAILCEPDNYESLKNAIAKVTEDKALLGLGSNNRDEVIANYSWSRRVDKIVDFFNS